MEGANSGRKERQQATVNSFQDESQLIPRRTQSRQPKAQAGFDTRWMLFILWQPLIL